MEHAPLLKIYNGEGLKGQMDGCLDLVAILTYYMSEMRVQQQISD